MRGCSLFHEQTDLHFGINCQKWFVFHRNARKIFFAWRTHTNIFKQEYVNFQYEETDLPRSVQDSSPYNRLLHMTNKFNNLKLICFSFKFVNLLSIAGTLIYKQSTKNNKLYGLVGCFYSTWNFFKIMKVTKMSPIN